MKLMSIKASQPQHTDAGNLVGKLYYRGTLDKLLTRTEYSGYPHNGGEHTLHLRLSAVDLDAFLDAVGETYAGHPGVPGFIQSCRASATHQAGLVAQRH